VFLPLVVTLVLSLIGMAVVAKVALTTVRRLGLDFVEVLEWLGLAETPLDELTARRIGTAPRRRLTLDHS